MNDMTGIRQHPSPAAADPQRSRAVDRIVAMHAGYQSRDDYVDAFLARPADSQPRPGVILLSGMYGLTWTQRELTRLYARAGFVALSPDYLGGQRPSTRAEALQIKNSLDIDRTVEHLAAGADFLRRLPWVGPNGPVGIMGFCLGGGLVLLATARTDRFQAGVVYHQSLFPDPVELQSIKCRLLCHYGTADHSTPREEVESFTRVLDQYGKAYEIHWYDGMEHSFAQIAPDAEVAPAQRAAADLSHERTFEFLWRELGIPEASESRLRETAVGGENEATPAPAIPGDAAATR